MSLRHPELLFSLVFVVPFVWWIFRVESGFPEAGVDVDGAGTGTGGMVRRWAAGSRLRGSAPPGSSMRVGRHAGRGVVAALGLACALVALARPQWDLASDRPSGQRPEVVVALDLSRSMAAQDANPSRLEQARLIVHSLLADLRGERMGLVVFAGTAYVQVPLSADTEIFRQVLDELGTDSLPQQGSDYAAMLGAVVEAFGPSGGEGATRFLVVLSDGETHSDAWRSQLAELRAAGIRVASLGLGTDAGASIPDGQGGWLRDTEGARVLSRRRPETLEALAAETGGVYRSANVWLDVASLLEALPAAPASLRSQDENERDTERGEGFQWMLGPAVALLLLALLFEIPVAARPRQLERGSQGATRVVLVGGSRMAAVLASVGLLVSALGLSPSTAPARAEASEGARAPDSPLPGAGAGSEAESAPPDPLAPIAKRVAELAARPTLAPGDCAGLATVTLGAASGILEQRPETARGIVGDALLAVDLGEALDPSGAGWTGLRDRLLALSHEVTRREAGAEGLLRRQALGEAMPGDTSGRSEEDELEGEGVADTEEELSELAEGGRPGEPEDLEIEVGSAEGASRGDGAGAARDIEDTGLGVFADETSSDLAWSEVGGLDPQPTDDARLLVGRELMEQVRALDSPASLYERMGQRRGGRGRGARTSERPW